MAIYVLTIDANARVASTFGPSERVWLGVARSGAALCCLQACTRHSARTDDRSEINTRNTYTEARP